MTNWLARLRENAFLLLAFTSATWGANGVVSRAVVGDMSPMTMVTLRWLFVCGLILPPLWGELRAAAPIFRARWRYFALMALCGYTGFNVLFYLAGLHTTAVNITLLQGAIPASVLAGGALFRGLKVTAMQVLGMCVSFVGVGLIATHGHLLDLAQFKLNIGDAMMLVACMLYAGYTLALRDRPPLPPLVFFAGMAVLAFGESLPFFAWEILSGGSYWPSAKGWALVVFVAIFPSLISQIFFMRGVELIGPGRAGIFTNLTPLFGAFFAIVLLGEPFHSYHAGAVILGLGGIALAEVGRRR